MPLDRRDLRQVHPLQDALAATYEVREHRTLSLPSTHVPDRKTSAINLSFPSKSLYTSSSAPPGTVGYLVQILKSRRVFTL